MSLPAEFALIARHFRPLAGPAALDLADDAAVFAPPPDRELVVTTDTMVAGTHFPPDDPAESIARKLLRVNLSDIAAMGAAPYGYLLALSMPTGVAEAWLSAFAAGLGADQAQFGLQLLGGDTTRTAGPLSLTVTMLGHVAPGAAWRRGGARAGDELWLTGQIGRGVLGLRALRGGIADPDGSLMAHYRVPQPRLGLGLHGVVHAAMDISDGLVQDAGHMARASGLSLIIDLACVPLCPQAVPLGAGFIASGEAGGDDYELLIAAPGAHGAALSGAGLTRIGRCAEGPPEVILRDAAGSAVAAGAGGWSHF